LQVISVSSQTHFQDGAYSVVGLLTLRHCTKEELKKAPLKTPKKMMIRIVKAMIKASKSDEYSKPILKPNLQPSKNEKEYEGTASGSRISHPKICF